MKGLRFIVMAMFLPFSITISFAQKEANIWYFGEYAGLDFNSGVPVPLTNGKLNTYEGCATISDYNGNLLFYTDGITIWDKTHNIMQNGTNLKGSSNSTNSAIIVPKPDNSNYYYVFTLDAVVGGNTANGMAYTEVNMALNGGLGGVTSNKNIVLHQPSTEKLTAIKISSENAYWVIGHKLNSNEFLSYKVTSSGVNTTPLISAIGSIVPESGSQGTMKVSPNGKKIAMAFKNVPGFFEIYDFDATTGAISNPLTIPMEVGAYGIEFSPDGNLLYVGNIYKLFQFNLNAGSAIDIHASALTLLDSYSPFDYYEIGCIQLATDEKIYVAFQTKPFLGVINNPNILGYGCNYIHEGVYLNGRSSKYGLPPFIQSYFRIDTIRFENLCFGDTTVFKLDDDVDSLIWDFGDPVSGADNTSTEFEPTHIFSTSGTYEVSVTAIVGSDSATETINVIIYETPTVTPLVELKQCDDDIDGFSLFNLTEVIGEITANIANETITFYETESDADSAINAITNTTVYKNEMVSSDIVWARIENQNGCFRTSKVNLTVTTTQIPETFIREFHVCDDEMDGNTTDGISIFDFSSVQAEIEGLFPSGQDLVINYYQNLANALAEIDPIADISNYRNIGYPYMQQIYVRVDSKIDNDCIGLGPHINLYVEPLPEFTVDTPQIVCSSDPTFTVVLDPVEANPTESFSYSWALDGVEISTTPTLTVSVPGTYFVTLTKADGVGCYRTREVFVNASELATISTNDITIVQLSDNNSITINSGNNNLGLGDYEFALDNSSGFYQDEPYFDHLSSGMHTLYVRDKKGCGIAQLDVFIMGFPKFFTPNDDGYNDTWNIEGLSYEYTQNSKVYVFDRYGKLIKQLNPRGEGWNGSYNGEKLRPSDYWFVVELFNVNGTMTTYRGHFSLVR